MKSRSPTSMQILMEIAVQVLLCAACTMRLPKAAGRRQAPTQTPASRLQSDTVTVETRC